MLIQFTIYGNQEKIDGNPIPYTRVVGKALWLPAARKYYHWKQFIKLEFQKQTRLNPLIFTKKIKARMDLKIYWKNKKHADPDNIFKGIADALFEDDNNLDGSFESNITKDKKPKVEVNITINEEKE